MKLAMPTNCLRGRIACAVVCLLLFAGFQLFAVVPQLHNWIHSDSNDATHQCELTLLTQGQVNSTTNDGLRLVFDSVILPSAPLTGTIAVSSALCQLPSERAPPFA
jgi:hypothetical protein